MVNTSPSLESLAGNYISRIMILELEKTAFFKKAMYRDLYPIFWHGVAFVGFTARVSQVTNAVPGHEIIMESARISKPADDSTFLNSRLIS